MVASDGVVGERDRLTVALQAYERAVFGGDASGLEAADRDLDAVEADVALARGRLLHARFLQDRSEPDDTELALFERAIELYRRLGDTRAEGEASFWIGMFHQVVRGDEATARPALERAYELSAATGDDLTLSYAARHLGFAAMNAGDLGAARERFEESVMLRRRIGFLPGLAAGLLALAEVAHADGREAEAAALFDEADSVARDCAADGMARVIAMVRADLTGA